MKLIVANRRGDADSDSVVGITRQRDYIKALIQRYKKICDHVLRSAPDYYLRLIPT